MSSYKDLTRSQQAIIYCVSALDELGAAGLVTGGAYKLGEVGKVMAAEMENDQVEFSEAEISSAMDTIQCASESA